ncbi:hypothetical protein TSUD_47450 [Trifolium subterraneum]|nr:hypothetical protein TSUD_47450 [Trifolium subterraneum]
MIEPYNKLVKLAARAFYDDLTSKTGRSDNNRGIAVIVLDALTSAAVAATADATTGKEGEQKVKLHTHSYCCLDYAQMYDVVRYRLHRMKHELKDELENKNTIQKYICTNCGKRYNALDALQLFFSQDEDFHCERCKGKLEVESDRLAAQEGGDGDENARIRRREKLKDMLQRMEVQLKPLIDQLGRVKDLPVPEFGSLQAWEARASAAGRAANGDNAGDSKSHLGYNGAPMPYSGDTKVVVDFNGTEGKGEGVKSETDSTSLKVLPPWMITSGMNLTKEQRGEDEYIKAYYAALLKKQHKLEEAAKTQDANAADDPSSSTSICKVGRKSKREEDDDGTKWEEAPVRGNGIGAYKVDLNVEADAPAKDDEDDIDWEEG